MTLFHYTKYIYVLPQVVSEFDAVLFSFLSCQYRTDYLGKIKKEYKNLFGVCGGRGGGE